jgi:hypothetical protein
MAAKCVARANALVEAVNGAAVVVEGGGLSSAHLAALVATNSLPPPAVAQPTTPPKAKRAKKSGKPELKASSHKKGPKEDPVGAILSNCRDLDVNPPS